MKHGNLSSVCRKHDYNISIWRVSLSALYLCQHPHTLSEDFRTGWRLEVMDVSCLCLTHQAQPAIIWVIDGCYFTSGDLAATVCCCSLLSVSNCFPHEDTSLYFLLRLIFNVAYSPLNLRYKGNVYVDSR